MRRRTKGKVDGLCKCRITERGEKGRTKRQRNGGRESDMTEIKTEWSISRNYGRGSYGERKMYFGRGR